MSKTITAKRRKTLFKVKKKMIMSKTITVKRRFLNTIRSRRLFENQFVQKPNH